MFRFSLKQLLVLVTLLALAVTALTHASELWAKAIAMTALGAVFSILILAFRDE